ncbi:MAG: spermidine/putrescine transport system substrate-binding protein [Frankiales bacterium]|nr:spermidine/putrescine transport system substrate-binding protein [Frankiales bacterium]
MSDLREDPMFRQLLAAQRLSRRGFIRGGASVAGAGALAACGTKGTKSGTGGVPATSGAAGAPTSGAAGATSGGPVATTAAAVPTYPDKSATDKKVNWSNWPLYIDIAAKGKGHPTIDAFTKATGIKVTYTEDVNDNDEFFGKVKPQLSSGQDTGRDIITLTDWMAGRLIRLGWVEKLDKTKIPNAANLIASLATPGFDPTRDYSLPWQSGMTGIAYNSKATGGVKVETIDQLLTDKKLKGKVTALTEMRDTMGLILLSMGKDPANFTDDDFGAGIDKLQKAVSDGQIRQFTGNDYAPLLGKGTVAACIAWSGDVIQLQSDNKSIQFVTPDTGSMLWADNMMIPQKAQHRANAEQLMNYYYQPDVAAAVADYVNYICPVKGAQEAMVKLDKSAASNPLIFPSAAVLAKTHIFKALTTAQETSYNTMFTKVTGA